MKLLEKIISVYAPLNCVACDSTGQIMCATCASGLPATESRCYRCHAPSTLGRTCKHCRSERDGSLLVSVNAATTYHGSAKDLLWRLKFGRVQAAADIMAAVMAERYGGYISDDVLVVPAPTATKRVRERGYDQAALIARSLAKRTGCRYSPLLVRLGTQEQIGAGKAQRKRQLQGVFQVSKPTTVKGRRILLIDDVITTGSTLDSAVVALVEAGAIAVGALVFARAEMEDAK